MTDSATEYKRLTHAEVRQACGARLRDKEMTCPVCFHTHLQLFDNDGIVCRNGCTTEDVAAEIRRRLGTGESPIITPSKKTPAEPPRGKLTLAEYGIAKHISAQLLEQWFCATESKHPYYAEVEGVCFPYLNERGEEVTQQWRWGMGKGKRGYLARKPTYLYGGRHLKLLEDMAAAGKGRREIFIVEGESNTHTLAQNNFPVLGLPGVRNWQEEWKDLKCFQAANRLYFFLDMKDGKPEDVAVAGARKIAECFPPGKVLAVKLPFKDISEMWLWHMTEWCGDGQEGFLRDLQDAILSARAIIPEREEVEGLPADLGEEVFNACPILRDFVAMTLPHVETDVNNLVCDFLACAGAAIGLSAYARHLADKHSPATFHLLIGDTSIGKGVSFGCTYELFQMAVPDWKKFIARSARSQQALYRMLNDVSAETIRVEEDGEAETKPNPDFNGGRLLFRSSEVSSVFKSMRAEWSTMSQALREAYDGTPLSNERSDKQQSIRVEDPYALAVIGDITKWELSETILGVDFANGVANRFIWCVSRRTKTIPHAERTPDYSSLADRLKRVLPTQDLGQISFSEAGLAAWDAWVYSLPLEDSGKLGSACGRVRPNALRMAVLFAVLDEGRLEADVPPRIEARHVQAAATILDRHRATVAWFLSHSAPAMPEMPERVKQKAQRDNEKIWAALVNDEITDTQLHRLFSNHLTVEERAAKAKAAGLERREEEDAKGNTVVKWKLVRKTGSSAHA